MKLDQNRDVTAKDIKHFLLKVYRDVKTGELSEAQAYREAFILNNVLKAIELTDLEERLNKIERLLSE